MEVNLDIIIEVKNVNQGFVPEPVSLRYLMSKIHNLYDAAIAPTKLDGRVRAIFEEAKSFEFFPGTGLYLPSVPVEVSVHFKYVPGGMQPPILRDFEDQAGKIAQLIDVFLTNTNNRSLNLPAFKNISLSTPGYSFGIRSN